MPARLIRLSSVVIVCLALVVPAVAQEAEKGTTDTADIDLQSLAKLRDGEEVQTRGTMLGAFSYELRRDPPIKVAPETPTVQ